MALEAVLEPLGLELVRARSGEEALRHLLRDEFAVILLDVRMPGLDGFETAALIKRRERTRHVPIIFVTAASKDTEHMLRGYSEGAVDYLLKPYDPAVLRSKVNVFVDLHQKRAALEESEQRFVAVFANAPSGMALVSPEGVFWRVNRALADMLGHPIAELAGSHWDSIVHPEEREEDRQAREELVEGVRTLYRAERRCLRADGHELVVALSVSRTTDEAGVVQELIAQLEDVADRQRAERERAEKLQERARRERAEAAVDLVERVQKVSDAALEHLALDDLLPKLLDPIADVFEADAVSVLLGHPDGEGLALRARRGTDGSEGALLTRFGEGTFEARVAKERRPVVIQDIREEDAGLFDADLRESGVRSLMAAPLIDAEGEVSGVLRVGSLSPSRFDQSDALLFDVVAGRAALAIGNADLFERERRIVETLQRSLLPARMPQLPGISIAARYQPGGADVGGDWYDAIELDDGVGLAMGDVVGHGIDAAATMGELRNALRAYALDGLSPGAVLARLEHLVEQLQDDQMTTLIYAVIDADWTEVRFASAGHLPPLVLRPDGSADFLWRGRSTPLGVGIEGAYEEGTASLAGGSTLVLYTDGLVEVRGEELLDGLERLRSAVVAGPTDPEALCDHVLESLLGSRAASDDVALLALRTTPLAHDLLLLELPTDPSSLRYGRRMLARWLAQAGASEKEASEIQLATHEAFANAIEHAYRFSDAVVELEARLADGEVALTISDTGDWREPVEGERGKGMDLMSGLMDKVSVDGAGGGTKVELRRRLSRDEGNRK